MKTMDTAPRQAATRVRRRVVLFVAPAVAFIALLAYGVVKAPTAPQIGERAPAFSAPLLAGGGTSSLQDYEGKPLVINFWASWCEPCKAEAPLLEEAHDAYEGQISFLGVDVRDARAMRARSWPSTGSATRASGTRRARSIAPTASPASPRRSWSTPREIVIDHVAGPLLRREELFTMLESW